MPYVMTHHVDEDVTRALTISYETHLGAASQIARYQLHWRLVPHVPGGTYRWPLGQ